MYSLVGKYFIIIVVYIRVFVFVLMNFILFRRVFMDDNFLSWNRCYILFEIYMKI